MLVGTGSRDSEGQSDFDKAHVRVGAGRSVSWNRVEQMPVGAGW